jgi:hypothetical protein
LYSCNSEHNIQRWLVYIRSLNWPDLFPVSDGAATVAPCYLAVPLRRTDLEWFNWMRAPFLPWSCVLSATFSYSFWPVCDCTPSSYMDKVFVLRLAVATYWYRHFLAFLWATVMNVTTPSR